jgi:MarR family 2-MHQ and catechol resistance regulon transcriptional repressor
MHYLGGEMTRVAHTAPAAPPSDPPTATALKLYVVLTRAAEALHAHARADIASHGLTEGEFAILEALYHKGRLLLGAVQREVLVSSGGVTFLVDRLEDRGLVTRAACETDRRARYALLTSEGRRLMDRIFPPHAEALRRAMSGLGAADQRKAIELMRTLGTEAAALPVQGREGGGSTPAVSATPPAKAKQRRGR